MFSATDIIASACAVIGEDPPASFDDDVPGGPAAGLIYQNVIGFIIGVHTFSFAREWFPLARIDGSAPVGFRYAYALPPERVGPPLRTTDTLDDPDRSQTSFLLKGTEIWSGAEQLWAECKIMPDPSAWSSTFRQAAITACAAELSLSLASDRNGYAVLHEKAYGPSSANFRGGYLGAAIAEDARATPARRLPSSNPLIAARSR